MRRGSDWVFFQGRHADGQQVQEDMLKITICREVRIRTTVKHHPTPVRMAVTKKQEMASVGKLEVTCSVAGGAVCGHQKEFFFLSYAFFSFHTAH